MSKKDTQVKFCELQFTDIKTNQRQVIVPAMVQISLTLQFVELAEKCVEFLNQNRLYYTSQWCPFGHTFYTRSAVTQTTGECFGEVQIRGEDGLTYEVLDRLFTVHGSEAKIFRDGSIEVSVHFNDTGARFWFSIGNIGDLKQKLTNHDDVGA